MKQMVLLVAISFAAACALAEPNRPEPTAPQQRGSGETTASLPDCDSLPKPPEQPPVMGTGFAVAHTAPPGDPPSHKMTQDELDERERNLDHTHLPAGRPETPCRHKEGPPSPVAPTTPPTAPTPPKG
jgi:hypothetical protein